MEKQKKSVGTVALVVLLLIVTIVSLVLATYAWAKYTTTSDPQTATANVAKWNVTLDNATGTFVQTSTHVTSGLMAPGTKGDFTVNLNPNQTDVCFNYEISVDSITLKNNANESLTGKIGTTDYTWDQFKSHIQIYYMKGKTDSVDGVKTTVAPGGSEKLRGVYDIAATPKLSGDKTICWEWLYSSDAANYDEIDTAAGEYAHANGLVLTINYTVKATQVDPNGTH